MPPKFTIRIATDSDFIEISKLVFSLFPHANPTNTNADAYFIAEPSNSAPAASPLIGFVHLRILENSVYLQGIGVLPQHRGEGIGARLLDAALNWCESEFPNRQITLNVKPSNLRAISLYTKDGFILAKDEGGDFTLLRAKPN